MLINPNPMWLVDTVTIAKVVGTDRYQKPTYDDPLTFMHVRFDRTPQYSGTNGDRTILKQGTVYLYGFNQSLMPADQSWLNAIVRDALGNEYVVQTISPHQQDTSTELYSVELGVI